MLRLPNRVANPKFENLQVVRSLEPMSGYCKPPPGIQVPNAASMILFQQRPRSRFRIRRLSMADEDETRLPGFATLPTQRALKSGLQMSECHLVHTARYRHKSCTGKNDRICSTTSNGSCFHMGPLNVVIVRCQTVLNYTSSIPVHCNAGARTLSRNRKPQFIRTMLTLVAVDNSSALHSKAPSRVSSKTSFQPEAYSHP